MMQAQKPGRRIVSRGEYTRLIGAKIGFGVIAFGVGFMMIQCLSAMIIFLLDSVQVANHRFDPKSAAWCLGPCCLAAYGSYRMFCYARTSMKKALRKEFIVPLTRANVGDLPAPASLVRASQEPMQANEGVLLRAATQSQGEHEEQLLRAVAEGPE